MTNQNRNHGGAIPNGTAKTATAAAEDAARRYKNLLQYLDTETWRYSSNYLDDIDTEEIGIDYYAKHEKDKKVRSGLVRFYNTLKTIEVRNAVYDAILRKDYIAFQAAAETLLIRNNDEVLLEALIKMNDVLLEDPDVFAMTLTETLARNNRNIRIAKLFICEKVSIGSLNQLLQSYTVNEIIGLKRNTLDSIHQQFELLGEENPKARIRGQLQTHIKIIESDKTSRSIAHMNPYVQAYLGIRQQQI